uniref:Uncharacterized protein n=1 Tax=viral metagenome TaxID=1070528 RepID=A0A6C0BCF2_9ZZZZ
MSKFERLSHYLFFSSMSINNEINQILNRINQIEEKLRTNMTVGQKNDWFRILHKQDVKLRILLLGQ